MVLVQLTRQYAGVTALKQSFVQNLCCEQAPLWVWGRERSLSLPGMRLTSCIVSPTVMCRGQSASKEICLKYCYSKLDSFIYFWSREEFIKNLVLCYK